MGVEISHEPDRVRQSRTVGERGSTLVVDQHERDRVRRIGRSQAGDQRLQQFRLASTRRACDECMWAVSYEVQHECAFQRNAEFGHWPRAGLPAGDN